MIHCWNPSNIYNISSCLCIIFRFHNPSPFQIPWLTLSEISLFLRKHAVGSAINCSLWESVALICRGSPVTWPAYFAPALFSVSFCSAMFLRSVGRCRAGCGWVCSRRGAVGTVDRLDSWCDYKYVCCAFTCAEPQDPPLFPPPWCFILCVHTARLVFIQSVSGSEELRLGISLFLRVICQVGRTKQEWLVQMFEIINRIPNPAIPILLL